ATTIAAPGQGLTVLSGDSGTGTVEGTSFAAALVTGAVTLLQDLYQSRFETLPTVAQLKSWIQQGSSNIHDAVTGIDVGELNVPASADLIPQPRQESHSRAGQAGGWTSPPTVSGLPAPVHPALAPGWGTPQAVSQAQTRGTGTPGPSPPSILVRVF